MDGVMIVAIITAPFAADTIATIDTLAIVRMLGLWLRAPGEGARRAQDAVVRRTMKRLQSAPRSRFTREDPCSTGLMAIRAATLLANRTAVVCIVRKLEMDRGTGAVCVLLDVKAFAALRSSVCIQCDVLDHRHVLSKDTVIHRRILQTVCGNHQKASTKDLHGNRGKAEVTALRTTWTSTISQAA